MSVETWLLFSGAALIVILIPGPLSLLMISNSLNYGLRRSYPAFLGGVIASIGLLSASALGDTSSHQPCRRNSRSISNSCSAIAGKRTSIRG